MNPPPLEIVLAIFFGTGIVLNTISRSRMERVLEKQLAESAAREMAARDELHRLTMAIAARVQGEREEGKTP